MVIWLEDMIEKVQLLFEKNIKTEHYILGKNIVI